MSRRAKLYWGMVGVAVVLAVSAVVVGLVGVLTDSHTLMGYLTGMIFLVFVILGVGFFIRGGLTKPHPR